MRQGNLQNEAMDSFCVMMAIRKTAQLLRLLCVFDTVTLNNEPTDIFMMFDHSVVGGSSTEVRPTGSSCYVVCITELMQAPTGSLEQWR
jgi:hypothetical protein